MSSTKRNGRKGRSINHTGRSKHDDQYIPISYPMAHSAAWRSLSGSAIKVYVELRTRYHGHNNGKLSLSMDEGARLLGMSKSTVKRAIAVLIDRGFITITRPGFWYGRQATLYSVTDRSLDGNLAINTWKQWRLPSKSSSRYSHGTYSHPDGSVGVPKA